MPVLAGVPAMCFTVQSKVHFEICLVRGREKSRHRQRNTWCRGEPAMSHAAGECGGSLLAFGHGLCCTIPKAPQVGFL